MNTSTALTVVEQVEKSPAVLMLDARSTALVDLLPDAAAANRFRRVVIQALTKNPELLECTPESVVSSVFEAAAMDLEPTGAAGGAHLVPYNVNVGSRERPRYEKRAQLIPDYRGVIRLVTKPPSEVLSMEARCVKEGDEFSYELGSDAAVHHIPSLTADRSTKATTHVYSAARLRNGAVLVDVEDRAGIERIQKRGRAGGFSPWSTDWDEMAKKTIIKRHAKVLPIRPAVRSILLREDELSGETAEADASDRAEQLKAAPRRTARLAARLAAEQRDTTPVEAPVFTESDAVSVPTPQAAQPPDAPPAARAARSDLRLRLRARAEHWEQEGVEGPASGEHWNALGTLEKAKRLPAIAAVLAHVWDGLQPPDISDAQAQAILDLAAEDGFAGAWAELVTAARKDAAA